MDIDFSVPTNASYEVSNLMFGANILFNRDRLGDDGTYDDVFDSIGFKSVRYPGGSVSEWYFDIDRPDKPKSKDSTTGENQQLIPLSEFIAWAGLAGVGVDIVIPTSDLVRSDGTVRKDAYDRVKKFVYDVLDGKYGEANILSFEIGNEYWLEGKLNIEQYTEIADVVARAAQAAIDTIPNLDEEPSVVVQAGQYGKYSTEPGWQQNDYLMNNLTDAAAEAIDAVAIHYYARGDYSDLASHDYYFDRLDTWANRPEFKDIEFHMTEWSTENWDTNETGLKLASTMLWMMGRMVERGVDAAYVWPVQQNTHNDLSGDEGSTELTHGGEMMRMMTESIAGETIYGRINYEWGDLYIFSSETGLTVFAASRTSEALDLTFDMDRVAISEGHYDIEILGSDGSPGDHNAEATIETISGEIKGEIKLHLDPFEVGRIIVSPGTQAGSVRGESDRSGVDLYGEKSDDILRGAGGHDHVFGGRGDDTIFGGKGFDDIRGNGGNDRLIGGNGNDTMAGGAGNDLIKGGSGQDYMFAQSGHDAMRGKSGHDKMWGGSGNDHMLGQNGDDRMYGHSGKDRMWGGSGDDLVFGGFGADALFGGYGHDSIRGGDGNDRMMGGRGGDKMWGNWKSDVMYGQDGLDTMFGGRGADHMRGGSGGDRLRGGSGNDTIYGNMGDDVIVGGSGNDVLKGGGGADVFVFAPSHGRDRIVGFNNADTIDLSAFRIEKNDIDFYATKDGYMMIVDEDVKIKIETDHRLQYDDFVF